MNEFVLGKYCQHSNQKEPIIWKTLHKCEDKLLLISKYALVRKVYNNSLKYIAWELSSLRNWLNNDFYNDAFTENEKKLIIPNETDKVRLLTTKEAETYFSSSEDRVCFAPPYTFASDSEFLPLYRDCKCGWWLMETVMKEEPLSAYIPIVEVNGSIKEIGMGINVPMFVRPVICIKT